MPYLRLTLLTVATLLLASGCGNESTPDTSADSPEETTRDAGTDRDSGTAAAEDEMEDKAETGPEQLDLAQAIEAARADLAERSGIDAQEISVVQARSVTWRNGALGCPEEGMMYTQALVEGFYIRLSAGADEYAYHAGRDGQPFACPAERSQPPAPDGEEPAAY